jgi:hypothetical protein
MYITSWRQPDIRPGTVYICVRQASKSLFAARLPAIRKRKNGAQYARIKATEPLIYSYICTRMYIGTRRSLEIGLARCTVMYIGVYPVRKSPLVAPITVIRNRRNAASYARIQATEPSIYSYICTHMYIGTRRSLEIGPPRCTAVYIGVYPARKSPLVAPFPPIRKRRNGAKYA